MTRLVQHHQCTTTSRSAHKSEQCTQNTLVFVVVQANRPQKPPSVTLASDLKQEQLPLRSRANLASVPWLVVLKTWLTCLTHSWSVRPLQKVGVWAQGSTCFVCFALCDINEIRPDTLGSSDTALLLLLTSSRRERGSKNPGNRQVWHEPEVW